MALGEGDKWPGMHMWAYLVTRIGGKANFEGALLRTGSFTDAPFVEAGKKLQELLALQPFQDGFLGATYGDEATAMGNGKAAMELMGQWAPSSNRPTAPTRRALATNWASSPSRWLREAQAPLRTPSAVGMALRSARMPHPKPLTSSSS